MPRARQARRLPLHLAVGDGGSDVLRAATSTAPTCSRCTRSIRRRRRRSRWCDKEPLEFLDDRFLQRVVQGEARRRRCSSRRATGVEQAAEHVQERAPRINTAFYHGGEPIRVHPALPRGRGAEAVLPRDDGGGTERAQRAGARHGRHRRHALHVNSSSAARTCSRKLHLGANEILQMAGRVHGRVEGGRVFILSDRDIDFFVAPADGARVPARRRLGARRDHLRRSRRARRTSSSCRCRSIASPTAARCSSSSRAASSRTGRLTRYGKRVEAMPVERAWAELLVNADDALVPYLAVMSGDRVAAPHDARGARPRRADRRRAATTSPRTTSTPRRTASAGYIGEVYGLPRHLFDEEEIDRVGGAARRAGEVDRGCGAGDGERVSRPGHAAAGATCRWRTRARAAQFARAARASTCRSIS